MGIKKNGHNSVTVQNRTHVYMNFFHHKDFGNHLLQLCPKVVKHPVCAMTQPAFEETACSLTGGRKHPIFYFTKSQSQSKI